jgi:hypothetical protein
MWIRIQDLFDPGSRTEKIQIRNTAVMVVMVTNFFKSFPIPTKLPSHTSLPFPLVKSFSFQLLFPHTIVNSSVANPGCLSLIPDPEFYPSRIPHPKTATKEREEKKLLSCHIL